MTDFAFPMRHHRRGHPVHLFADRRWRWADTGRFIPRPTGARDPARSNN